MKLFNYAVIRSSILLVHMQTNSIYMNMVLHYTIVEPTRLKLTLF